MSESKFKPIAYGFHGHSDVGSQDSSSTPAQRIHRAKELGRAADALTDHGSMSGLIPHYFAAKAQGIKSIHGIELYVVDERRPAKVYKNGKVEPKYTHQTLLFRTQEAYEYMCKMTPIMEDRAIVKYGESKPLIYWNELLPLEGQIVLGSGCLVGQVTKNINDFALTYAERLQWAEEEYLKLKKLSGNIPLCLEIFPHDVTKNWTNPNKDHTGYFKTITEDSHICSHQCDGIEHITDECGHLTIPIDLQKRANDFIVHMSRKYGDKLHISEDSHFAYPKDKIVQDMKLNNGITNWTFSNSYHMASSDEWAESLKKNHGFVDRDIEEMIDNSYESLEYFSSYKVRTNKDGWLVPTATQVYGDAVKGMTNKEILYNLIEKHGKMRKTSEPDYEVYKSRLDYEIEIFGDNGTVDLIPYFFPVEDAVDFAKKNDELVNIRGSFGGSYIAYLLGMSITDPIKYKLPIERAISKGRIAAGSMPDSDTDWEDRGVVLDYLRAKYKDSISLIGTELSIKLKSAILDAERSIDGEVDKETSKMTKILPNPPPGVAITKWLNGYNTPEGDHVDGFLENKQDYTSQLLNNWIAKYPKKWELVSSAMGITKTRGVHAGGVLITPGPVQNYCPLIKNKNGDYASAYNMKYVEEIGLIKYDYLGVSMLKALGIAVRSIAKTTGNKIVWDEFPHDPDVYKNIYAKGLLCGLFQVDTPTMRPFVNKITPRNTNDLSNLVALVRPGALDAPAPDPVLASQGMNAADYFTEVHNGRVKPYFIHPDLIPIFGETYGVCLMQEQIMQVFTDIVGYTMTEADDVRRGVSKKVKAIMDKHLGVLRDVCTKRGWAVDQIDALVETLIASARYSFNKAHSASYGICSYNCAYIKYHYPLHYWLGFLTISTDDHDDLKHYLSECGDLVLPVSVLKSHPTEWRIEGDKLRPPLKLLKGCGGNSVEKIRDVLQLSLTELRDRLREAEIEQA